MTYNELGPTAPSIAFNLVNLGTEEEPNWQPPVDDSPLPWPSQPPGAILGAPLPAGSQPYFNFYHLNWRFEDTERGNQAFVASRGAGSPFPHATQWLDDDQARVFPGGPFWAYGSAVEADDHLLFRLKNPYITDTTGEWEQGGYGPFLVKCKWAETLDAPAPEGNDFLFKEWQFNFRDFIESYGWSANVWFRNEVENPGRAGNGSPLCPTLNYSTPVRYTPIIIAAGAPGQGYYLGQGSYWTSGMTCQPRHYHYDCCRPVILVQPNDPGACNGVFVPMPPAVADERYGSLWMGRVDQSTSDPNACANYVANRNAGLPNPPSCEPQIELELVFHPRWDAHGNFVGGGYELFVAPLPFSPPLFDLDIDSDNNNDFGPPDRNTLEDLTEDNPSKPGKIVYVNGGDADADGIPDFAHGFNLDSVTSNDDDESGQIRFVPVVLELPPEIDWASATLTLNYNAAVPANVTFNDGDWSAGQGYSRLWLKDGGQPRNKESANAVANPGDFVEPGTYSDLSKLGLSAANNTVTLYLEGISPSLARADQQISIELNPGGGAPPGSGMADQVRVTVVETALVRVDENNNTWKTTTLEVSHPSPTINLSVCTVSGVFSPGPDYQHLQGQLDVAGIVKSAVSDIYPDEDKDIDEVRIFVNDLDPPVATVFLTKSKTQNPESLARPFDYTGSFSEQLNVALEYGPNLVRVEAADKVFGIKGYTEYIVEVTGQPPVVVPTAVPAAQSSGGSTPESGEEEQEWMSYEGWTFPGDTGTGAYEGALAKQSNGGDFKPYLVEFIGPQTLLQDLQSVNVDGVERRLRRYGNRVFLGLKQVAAIESDIATVLLGVAADYTEVHWSRDHLSLDYYQGYSLGFCEGGVYLVGDLATLATKVDPFRTIWRFAQGDFLTEERHFLLNTYKAVEHLAAFWEEWHNKTADDIMTADPEADPVEVALGLVSEDYRVLGEAAKHIIVTVGEQLQQMDSFDRGRVEGRIGFEVVTLLIAEVKVGQAAKVTKVKEIGLVENIATKVEQAVDAGKLAKGDAALGQKLKDAMAAARLRIRQFSTTGRYEDLPTLPDYARNHLNQAAAFESDLAGQSFIPRADGVCHYLKGPFVNQSKWAGSGHWRFHSKMEEFWRPYRKNGALYGQRPTCGQYSDALHDSLTHSGVPPEEVEHLITLARNDRMTLRTRPDGSQFRLLDSDLVPKIPKPVPLAPPPG